MVKVYADNEGYRLIVGETREIKAIYRTIAKCSDLVKPLYADFPKFNKNRIMYGIEVTPNQEMFIINSDEVLALLLDDEAGFQEV